MEEIINKQLSRISLSFSTTIELGKRFIPGETYLIGGITYTVVSNHMDDNHITSCYISMKAKDVDISEFKQSTTQSNDNSGWYLGHLKND